jgi:tetratricopeptide (TPR) repeat protein
MSEATSTQLVERARDAVARGEWQRAHELLTEADTRGSLRGPDLALLAEVAYASGRLDVTIDAWERAHAQAMQAGDGLAAAGAAVRVALHLLLDTALMAPVRGWITRAERLLEGHDATSAVHAWLAVVHNYERLLSGDFESARRWARQAIDVGTKCDPSAAALGRVAEARSMILAGEVSRGVELLNEAAVATLSGELDPITTGIVYCEVVCAFQALAQYDLAEEWTAAMEQWHHGQPVGSVHGRCRVHRAEILRLRGSNLEAEREALSACEELRPYLRREFGWPLTELGRIRLRTGDIDGADEAFRSALDVGWDAQPGLALVALARGDLEQAAKSIGDALANASYVPSKELPPHTELRRAPLLEAQVEIELAAGNVELARSAADDLARVAAVFESKALVACAALAHGRVALANDDATIARQKFEEAARLWSEIGAPYETALAQMGLARAHRASENEASAILEFQSARSTFERVGATRLAAEAAHECSDAGREGLPHRERPSVARSSAGIRNGGENVFRREGDYWSMEFDGLAVRLRDAKGLRYLARLLAEPGRELHVLDLVAAERDGSVKTSARIEDDVAIVTSMDAGVMLDARAKEAYRRRLAEIDDDIEEARLLADSERAAQAEAERDFLARELARAVGLGGRDRRAGSSSERARASVTRAVRQVMVRISEHHPALGEHLGRAIRTGTYCRYLPDTRVPTAWRL